MKVLDQYHQQLAGWNLEQLFHKTILLAASGGSGPEVVFLYKSEIIEIRYKVILCLFEIYFNSYHPKNNFC